MTDSEKLDQMISRLNILIVLQLNSERSRLDKARILVDTGVSKAEVARLLGMDQSNFNKLMKGKNGKK